MRRTPCWAAPRRSRLVFVAGAAAGLVGCGTQAAPGGHGFSASLLARVSRSVARVGCRPLAKHESTSATAFAIGSHEAVTAYHVVQPKCFQHEGEITVSGGRSAVVAAESSTSGLALLKTIASHPWTELRPARAHIGERLALLGYPHGRANARLRVTYGSVLGMGQVATLRGPSGTETLRDAIVVSAPAARGESGGPAIDTTGRVVGVFQGGDSAIRLLTPALDLCTGRARVSWCR